MQNQKRVLEIMIYIILLATFTFIYFADIDISFAKDEAAQTQTADENIYLEEVPTELIYDNFKFEGD